MHRRILFLVLLSCLGAAPGCGQRVPPAASPEQAKEALRAALDAWKQGETTDNLLKRAPPIHMSDHDWKEGWKLKSYRFSAVDEAFGQQWHRSVVLSLESQKGKAAAKEVTYYIDTSPAIVIVRAFE